MELRTDNLYGFWQAHSTKKVNYKNMYKIKIKLGSLISSNVWNLLSVINFYEANSYRAKP